MFSARYLNSGITHPLSKEKKTNIVCFTQMDHVVLASSQVWKEKYCTHNDRMYCTDDSGRIKTMSILEPPSKPQTPGTCLKNKGETECGPGDKTKGADILRQTIHVGSYLPH